MENNIVNFYNNHNNEYVFRNCEYKEIESLILNGHIFKRPDDGYRVFYLSNNIEMTIDWDIRNFVIAYNKSILKRQGLIEFPNNVIEFIEYCDEHPEDFDTIGHSGWSWERNKEKIVIAINTYLLENPDVNPEELILDDIDEFEGINIFNGDLYIKEIKFEQNLIHNVYLPHKEGKSIDKKQFEEYKKLKDLMNNL
jgi:ABC-type glycerol-3-phosphate transport system substrate-binding protein